MARAAVVSINLTTGEMYHTIYSTDEGFENPSQAALNMRERIRADFPEMNHGIIEDDEAKEIRVNRTLEAMGITKD